MLEQGITPNHVDKDGNTVIHNIVQNFDQSLAKNMAILSLFIDHKADGNLFNSEGLAPMHLACLYDQVEAVQYMIEINKKSQKNIFDIELKGK